MYIYIHMQEVFIFVALSHDHCAFPEEYIYIHGYLIKEIHKVYMYSAQFSFNVTQSFFLYSHYV